MRDQGGVLSVNSYNSLYATPLHFWPNIGLEPTIQQVRKQSCSVATVSLTSSNLSLSLSSIPMSGASQPFTVDAIIAEKTHEAGETGEVYPWQIPLDLSPLQRHG